MSIFLVIEILLILIGLAFIYKAFSILRPREEEQRRVQDDFLFYLIFGLLCIAISLLIFW